MADHGDIQNGSFPDAESSGDRNNNLGTNSLQPDDGPGSPQVGQVIKNQIQTADPKSETNADGHASPSNGCDPTEADYTGSQLEVDDAKKVRTDLETDVSTHIKSENTDNGREESRSCETKEETKKEEMRDPESDGDVNRINESKSSESPPSSTTPSAKSSRSSSLTKFGMKITAALSKMDFSNADAETAISLMGIPSIKTYSALNRRLRQCDRTWMRDFLAADGLETLLDAVASISSRRVRLEEALLLAECVSCVKSVLNSQVGLEYILQRHDHVAKLVKGNNICTMYNLYRLDRFI